MTWRTLLVVIVMSGVSAAVMAFVYFDVAGADADTISLRHTVATLAVAALALVVFATVLAGSVTRSGGIASPRSFVALLVWLVMGAHLVIVAGLIANFQASLDMKLAVSGGTGTEVRFASPGHVVLDGDIGHLTLASLQAASEQGRIVQLEIDSPGGFLDAAIAIGDILAGDRTHVIVRNKCESACVIVALSGARLSAPRNAWFGFHRGSAAASPDSELGRFASTIATEDLLARLAALGVPRKILDIAEKTPPDDMYYVSGLEMFRMGLVRELLD